MNRFDLKILVNADAKQEARRFLYFLCQAGKRRAANITIGPRTAGSFRISIGDGDKFELFLQELMLDRALYYYLCTLPNRRELARTVVTPIFRQLLESRFNVIYPSLLARHVLKGSFASRIAAEFRNDTAQEYEILFRRLDLKIISGYQFVRDLDDLLTEFMLKRLGHAKGQESPKFATVVFRCAQANILRQRETCKLFNRVHALRTRGLHRLEREIDETEISHIAREVYFFFYYFDEFLQAQEWKTVIARGKRYRRIRYGKEPVPDWFTPEERREEKSHTRPCHDCGVLRGELHLDGCDWEKCPCCLGQRLGCSCFTDDNQ